ncbi:MAG: Helix-turn-helix domain [Pseudomonadota bacterium]
MQARSEHSKRPRMNLKAAEGPFARYVKQKRIDMGLTQRELAEITGISFPFIQDVERGSLSLRLSKLVELLSALGGELFVADRQVNQADALLRFSAIEHIADSRSLENDPLSRHEDEK